MSGIISNKRGYTLIELITYLVVGAIVISLGLSLIRATSRHFVHQRRVSRMQGNGRTAVRMMARDLINTGFKSYMLEDVSNPGEFDLITIKDSVILNDLTSDSLSSFRSFNGNPYDSIRTYRITLNDAGVYNSCEKISYYVANEILYRTRHTLNEVTGLWENMEKLAFCDNVAALQFQFSDNITTWLDASTVATHRADTKYIKIFLLITTDKRTDFGSPQSYSFADITFTSTDSRSRRLYEETVAIVNNGLF